MSNTMTFDHVLHRLVFVILFIKKKHLKNASHSLNTRSKKMKKIYHNLIFNRQHYNFIIIIIIFIINK